MLSSRGTRLTSSSKSGAKNFLALPPRSRDKNESPLRQTTDAFPRRTERRTRRALPMDRIPRKHNKPALRKHMRDPHEPGFAGAGYPNPGAWPIKAGKYKGRSIETMQRKLSNWLVRQLGPPEKFTNGRDAEDKIRSRRGIISFFSIYRNESTQGHIAIVAPDRWGLYTRCGNELDGTNSGCFWSSKEVWFWEFQ